MRRKPLFSCPQSENGIVTPPFPLKAVVAQRGASWGIYQREKNRTNLRCWSRSARPASIADGIPPAAETGEPVPLFGLQEKGWRQTASQFTSDGQCPPKYRNLQYLQIEVKIRKREKSWSQKIKKPQILPIIREVWPESENLLKLNSKFEKVWRERSSYEIWN